MGNCPLTGSCRACVRTVTPMHMWCAHMHARMLTCAHIRTHACHAHLHTLAAAPQVCLCTLASWGVALAEEEEGLATQGGSNLGVRPGAAPPWGQAQGDSDSSGPLAGVRGWRGVCRVEGTSACQPWGRKKPTVLQGPDVHQLGRGQRAGQVAPSTDPRLRNPNSHPHPGVLAPRPERPQARPLNTNLPEPSAPQPWAPDPPSPGGCMGASKPRKPAFNSSLFKITAGVLTHSAEPWLRCDGCKDHLQIWAGQPYPVRGAEIVSRVKWDPASCRPAVASVWGLPGP